ncbi:hypothetical protein NBRC3257_0736 [Gluconobacter thailandicus NBRC 3257]|uniref:Transposase n=1 Tax=Gluconobacter thailandicus NBRC 3257 TaxID=1381097 RepID=A0ABQ0IU37_GLUTH|nr:hypothetical protein NBRC3255_1757 [Gluconobacter thailandicus NBRC 3255]GAD25737.1 hypothetical protein NBRC3257_0736 [Gluconobacter thailandicus NBRC 3257]
MEDRMRLAFRVQEQDRLTARAKPWLSTNTDQKTLPAI